MLPTVERSGMVQRAAFQSAAWCVGSVLRLKVFPDYVGKGGVSLHRFRFQGHIAGVSGRPILQKQPLTTDVVFQYSSVQPNKRKFRTISPDIHEPPMIHLD